jgi:plasmid stabilization system protein ParE
LHRGSGGRGDRDLEIEEERMPSWSRKDERKYEHIKESAEDRGTSEERAKEIAARTVNRDRREEGRTPNRRTQGTGNPSKGLEARTRDELYNRARQLDIEGRSRMNKDELVKAIRGKS